jgi:hypothetical protein
MKRSSSFPETLCGARRSQLPVPVVFAQDNQRHGRALDAPVLDNIGYRNSLADEFCGASGFEFDWGLVVSGFPEWYYPGHYRPQWVWRIVPTALWGRATVHHRLPQAIHETASLLRSDAVGGLWSRLPGWVEGDPGLSYDLCALLVHSHKNAARLVALLECELLPHLLPPVLRLMEARLQQILKGATGRSIPASHLPTLH